MTQKELEEIQKLMEQGYFTAFRTGVWEASNGKIHNVTRGDLETIIHNFENGKKDGKEVTLSVEHLESEESQQGIIEKVIRCGDYLFAKAKNIKTDFLEKLKHGLYKFVSVALDDKYGLLHIGCTNRPAVEGLFPITEAFSKFSKEDSIVFKFELSYPDKQKEKDLTLLQNVHKCLDCMMRDGGKFVPNDNLFTKDINKQKEESMKDVQGTTVPETKPEDKTAEFQRKLTDAEQRAQEAEQKAQAAEQKVADIEEQNRKTTIATFTKSLLQDAKLYPNEVDPMTEFLLKQNDRETHKFSKDAQKEETPLQYIQGFLKGLPKRLPLEKIEGTQAKTGQDNACFSRIKPDEGNIDLHYRAKALMDKEKISYEEALSRLED